MRRGRAGAQDAAGPQPEDVAFCYDVALLTRDALEGYGRLLDEYEERGTSADLRTAAISMAQRIAAYERLGFVKSERLMALPEDYVPSRALGILLQLTLSLVTLGQEEPDGRTLLSRAEVESLVSERDLRPWLDLLLEDIPADWEVL